LLKRAVPERFGQEFRMLKPNSITLAGSELV